jgi:hypothetical protein
VHKIELIIGDSVVATYPVSWTEDVDQLGKLAEQLRIDNAASGWRIIDQLGRLVKASYM